MAAVTVLVPLLRLVIWPMAEALRRRAGHHRVNEAASSTSIVPGCCAFLEVVKGIPKSLVKESGIY